MHGLVRDDRCRGGKKLSLLFPAVREAGAVGILVGLTPRHVGFHVLGRCWSSRASPLRDVGARGRGFGVAAFVTQFELRGGGFR